MTIAKFAKHNPTGYKHRVHRSVKNRKLINKKKKCWYCGRVMADDGKSLFCKKCEKIKIKDVPRSELENYYMKV